MDTSQPGPLMMLVGGILMALGSILSWGGDTSGLSLDALGLFGIIILIIAIATIVVGAVRAFGLSVKLPDQVLGYSIDQLLIIGGFAVFLWTFALVASDINGGGVHLTWIGAAVAVVGSTLNSMSAAAGSAS